MVKSMLLISAACFVLGACATSAPAPQSAPRPAPQLSLTLLGENSGPVHSIAWTKDSQKFVSAGKAEVNLWTPNDPHSVATWKGHSSYVWVTAWSPDGTQLATLGSDGVLMLRDAKTGAPTKTFAPVSDNEFWALAWSPDGSQIAVGTDHWEVLIYSSGGGEPEHHPAFGSSIQSLAWSPDGKLLALGDLNGVVALWNTKTWELERQMTVESDRIAYNTYALAWSPDGKELASGHDDGVVRLWRPDRDTAVGQLSTTGPVRCLAWSPDGRWVAAGGEGLALWDHQSPAASLTLAGSRDPLWSVAWSPDGKFLAAGNGQAATGDHGQVLLWSVE